MTVPSSNIEDVTKPASLAGWKKAATHYPLLPSGVRVGLKIPDLPGMIVSGKIPNHLLEAAVGASRQQADADKDLSPDEIVSNARQEIEFTNAMVLATVVEPKLSEEDLDDLPVEDKHFLVALATRNREFDAEGEHIAGLTSSAKFRKFRGIGEFEPSLEDE